MRIKRGVMSAVVISVIIIAVLLNSLNYTSSVGGTARIIVSLNYGKMVIINRTIHSGKTVLDSLKSVANVSTTYGGGFVKGINGIMCDENKKMDWFYFVNGILANVGASQYRVRSGDVIRWDYHHWDNRLLINSEIMDFPEPLLHGYNGKKYRTVIAYEDGYKDIGELLYSYLKKRVDVDMKNVGNITQEEKKSINLIVIGANSSLSQEINNLSGTGFFYHLEGGFVKDYNGTCYHGGFAEITQSPYNPKGTWGCENVLIFISGNSHSHMKNVVERLIDGNISSFWEFEGERV